MRLMGIWDTMGYRLKGLGHWGLPQLMAPSSWHSCALCPSQIVDICFFGGKTTSSPLSPALSVPDWLRAAGNPSVVLPGCKTHPVPASYTKHPTRVQNAKQCRGLAVWVKLIPENLIFHTDFPTKELSLLQMTAVDCSHKTMELLH